MKRFEHIFPTTAGLVLLAMATAQVIGNQGAITLQPADPILGLPSRYLFWALAALETVVAAICLFSKSQRLKHTTVFGLTSYVVLYNVGLLWMGVHSISAYFGAMAVNFGISPGALDFIFSAGVGFLWCGSGFLFLLPHSPREVVCSQAFDDSPIPRGRRTKLTVGGGN